MSARAGEAQQFLEWEGHYKDWGGKTAASSGVERVQQVWGAERARNVNVVGQRVLDAGSVQISGWGDCNECWVREVHQSDWYWGGESATGVRLG